MTGKEKLIEWIKNASVDDISKHIIGCPEQIGLEDNCSNIPCLDCIKDALNKEY